MEMAIKNLVPKGDSLLRLIRVEVGREEKEDMKGMENNYCFPVPVRFWIL